jgi:hypothetical protein
VRTSRKLLVLLLGSALTVLAAYFGPRLYETIAEYRLNECPSKYILALHQSRNREQLCPR